MSTFDQLHAGAEPPALDARGHDIRPGDTVLYIKDGQYPEKVAGIVESVGKMVTIGALDQISPVKKVRTHSTTRVRAASLIVVDALPHVEGHLNTPSSRPAPPVPRCGDLPEREPLPLQEYARRRDAYHHAMGVSPTPATEQDRDKARTLPDALRYSLEDAVRSHESSLNLYRVLSARLAWADYLGGFTDIEPSGEAGHA